MCITHQLEEIGLGKTKKTLCFLVNEGTKNICITGCLRQFYREQLNGLVNREDLQSLEVAATELAENVIKQKNGKITTAIVETKKSFVVVLTTVTNTINDAPLEEKTPIISNIDQENGRGERIAKELLTERKGGSLEIISGENCYVTNGEKILEKIY